MRRFFLCALLGVLHVLSAELIEAPHFRDIEKHVSMETLVIVDLDDTLFAPVQMLGGDAWFEYQFQKNLKMSPPVADPLDKTLALWESIRHLTDVQPVEEGSDKVLEKMQKSGVHVMGLTSQGLALATRTFQQLKGLGFDLTKTAPLKEDRYFVNGHGVLFRHGILFTSGTGKGACLLKFLEMSGLKPKKIVFIDDKIKQLQLVESALKSKGIPFVGLRYGFADERNARFKPEIAELQLRYSSFDRILSDAEAEEILMEDAE